MGITIFFLWLILSVIAANIASNKGNSGVVTFLGSILLSPLIGLLIAIAGRPNQAALDNRGIKSGRLKRCPHCAEFIKAKASICRYCGKDLPLLDKK